MVNIRKFWLIVLVSNRIEYWSNYLIRFKISNIRTALLLKMYSGIPLFRFLNTPLVLLALGRERCVIGFSSWWRRHDVIKHDRRHLIINSQRLIELSAKSPGRLDDVADGVSVEVQPVHDAVAAATDSVTAGRRADGHREAVEQAGIDAVRAVRLDPHACPFTLTATMISIFCLYIIYFHRPQWTANLNTILHANKLMIDWLTDDDDDHRSSTNWPHHRMHTPLLSWTKPRQIMRKRR